MEIPKAVQQYLKSISYEGGSFAYLQLAMGNHLIRSGGELSQFGLSELNTSIPVDEQLTSLSSLLPASGKPVVIANTQIDEDHFTDIHIYVDSGDQWVIFVDATQSAVRLQSEQQTRLNQDIKNERNHG